MQWISVKDRLPIKSGEYLCVWYFNLESTQGGKHIGVIEFNSKEKHFKFSNWTPKIITHWMPLPDLPEEDENE